MTTIPDLAAHIESICSREGITIESHSRGGRAWRKARRIAIRPVKSDITYAIALHEIGHILGPGQTGTRLEKETGAWQWAHENATHWTTNMTLTMRDSLRSYITWARARQYRDRPPVLPPAQHAVWVLASVSP